MRRGLLVLGSSLVIGLGAVVACDTGSAADATPAEAGGGTDASETVADSETPSSVEDAVATDAGVDVVVPPPLAKGDPCRGVAVPTDRHYVPSGMCARVVASELYGGRQITFAPNGDLFMQNIGGYVYKMRDANDDGFYQPNEIVLYGDTFGNGNNCEIDVVGGFLYCGSDAGVSRFTYSPNATSGGTAQPFITGMPQGGHHRHTVHIYDGYIYLTSGSALNASSDGDAGQSSYDTTRSVLKRFAMSAFTGAPIDWSTGQVVTTGLRNMNGFTKTTNGRMYGVVNGTDDLTYKGIDVHDDNPGEQVVQIAMGNHFGYPFCFTAQRVVDGNAVVTAGTQLVNALYPQNPHDDAWCAANSMKPTTFVQAHSAPLDLVFFDDDPQGALPERYRGGAFVALHGSWNRTTGTGYKVVWIPFDAQGNAPMPTSTATTTTFPYETVFGKGDANGPVDGDWTWALPGNTYWEARVRPTGVAISPIDGALYVMSDHGGNIYRIGLKK